MYAVTRCCGCGDCCRCGGGDCCYNGCDRFFVVLEREEGLFQVAMSCVIPCLFVVSL